MASLILILPTVITIVVFLPYTRFSGTENKPLTIVRANGETYRTETRYALEITSTNGLHDLWSRGMIAGYVALFLSPCAVFAYTMLSSFRRLRLLRGSEVVRSVPTQEVVWSQVVESIHKFRLWLSVLLGLLPSLILAGIYLSGVLFEIHQIRSLTVYGFELFRMVLILGVLLVGWWGTNFLAMALATALAFAVKEVIPATFIGIVTVFLLLVGMYIGTIIVFGAASPFRMSGAREFSVAEISALPLTLCFVAPFSLTALLLFLSRFLTLGFSGAKADDMLEVG